MRLIRRTVSPVWLVLFSCAFLGVSLHAQVAGPSKPIPAPDEPSAKSGNPIRTEVEMALVNVTVTDPYNRLVTGLEKENFRVYEDGIEQESGGLLERRRAHFDWRDLRLQRQHGR